MTDSTAQSDLDTLLAGLRAADAPPSTALQARVLADAVAVQATAPARPAMRPARRTAFRTLAEIFGGGGALAGMSLAAMAGLFIGVAQPAPVASLTEALLAEEPLDTLDLLPETDALWTED